MQDRYRLPRTVVPELKDLVLYWIGRAFGNRIFSYRWVQRYIPPHRHEKIVEGFHTHGVKILLSARLLPGLRTGVYMTAGAMRYPFVYFLIADGLYAIPGTGLIFFGSYFLAGTFELLIDEVHKVQYWLLALVVLAAAGFGLYRYFRVAREHAAHDDFKAPTLPELMHSKHVAPDAPKAQADATHATLPAPSTNNVSAAPSESHPAAKTE